MEWREGYRCYRTNCRGREHVTYLSLTIFNLFFDLRHILRIHQNISRLMFKQIFGRSRSGQEQASGPPSSSGPHDHWPCGPCPCFSDVNDKKKGIRVTHDTPMN